MSKNIFLIVGASGSGKTTLATALEKQHGLKSIQSYTTRPKRSEDETGHIFVSDEQFNKLENLVAYTEFCSFRYGANSEQVEENDLYIIDPKGIEYFKKSYRGNKQVKIIYIESPLHTRFERMENRGDQFNKVLERVVNDALDFREVDKQADIILHNNDDTKFSSIVHQAWEYIRQTNSTEEED